LRKQIPGDQGGKIFSECWPIIANLSLQSQVIANKLFAMFGQLRTRFAGPQGYSICSAGPGLKWTKIRFLSEEFPAPAPTYYLK